MGRKFTGAEPIGAILERVIVDAVTAPQLPLSPREARERRFTAEEVERQIQRALWRAERRSRKLPRHVRQGASWVNACRRRMAYELARWAKSVGASEQLADAIGARAAARFPRDGIVIAGDRPRERGTSPRQLGSSPRQLGESPRQLGRSPRQLRERDQ